MTAIAEPPVTAVPEMPKSSDARRWAGVSGWDVAEVVTLLLAAVVWARYVTTGAGGRDEGRLVAGLLSVVPALVATRCWRLPGRLLFAGGLMPVATLVVCLTTPYGWSGGQVAASWAYASGAFLAVAAFARTPARRQAAVVAVALISLDQFAQSFLAWWGGRDPSKPMVGTFYWHNQYAAFLTTGAMLGAGLTALTRGPVRRLGWIVTPLCVSGVIFSTSRAAMALVVVGFLCLAALSVRDRQPTRALARLACVGVLSLGAAAFFTSPLFFGSDGGSPLSALDKRSEAEPLAGNTTVRKEYLVAGLAELADRPLVGAGFSSFGPASQQHLPAGSILSPAAHSGLMQMYAEGGVTAGLPLTFVLLGVVGGMWRRLRAAADLPDRGTTVAVVVATGVLLSHAMVDFDWSYPALLVMAGVLVALLASLPPCPPQRAPLPLTAPRRALAAVPVVALVLASAAVADNWDRAQSALMRSRGERAPAATAQVLIDGRGALTDTRLDAELLEVALSAGFDGGLQLPESVVRQAVDNTGERATVDDSLGGLRDGARYLLGERADALASSRERTRRAAAYNTTVVRSYAILLVASGDRAAAADLLAREIVQLARSGYRSGGHLGALLSDLKALGDTTKTGCAADAIRRYYPTLTEAVNRLVGSSSPSKSCADLARGPVVA